MSKPTLAFGTDNARRIGVVRPLDITRKAVKPLRIIATIGFLAPTVFPADTGSQGDAGRPHTDTLS